MKPRQDGLPVVHLKPGEMFISGKPTLVITVLGSCVAATMFCRRSKTGAICHGLLPACKKSGPCDGSCLEGFRYIDCSIMRMVDEFSKRGIGPAEIELKLFGGADMFDSYVIANRDQTVGRQNIRMAQKIVEQEHLRISKSDLGGHAGRKILFYTDSGDVFLKRLGKGEMNGKTG